ncbi:hemerythrin domain-containing protein [Modestobacter sp. Leaf380]|uniref:hemerythrin domain-containing protein n=1 Tax=Modestobacter sp. Leaf380 TaxID=1736356 RepID=UPI001F226F45|nr:hemerythrin domain-containing protein [Modestobacter sp. Leaf380]
MTTTTRPALPSIADRPESDLGGPASVLVRQRADHVELDRLLHELDGSTGTGQRRGLRAIDRLVFSHAFAEEVVLWPVLRRTLPDGEELTTQVEQEHQEVNDLVARLETLGDDDPERARVLDRLTTVLREDVRDEEDGGRALPAAARAAGRRGPGAAGPGVGAGPSGVPHPPAPDGVPPSPGQRAVRPAAVGAGPRPGPTGRLRGGLHRRPR